MTHYSQTLRYLSAHYEAGSDCIKLTHAEVGDILDALAEKDSMLQRQHEALAKLSETDDGWMPRGTWMQWLHLFFWFFVGFLGAEMIARLIE